MSEHPPIHQALAAVMADVTHVGKTGHNKQQGYSFRGIDGVLNAVGPALRKHGVVVLPELASMSSQTIEVGKNRTLMREVTVEVVYTFVGPAGDTLTARVPGEAMDAGDKAVSKAMSVAMRTALIQALALPTDEPDPDESTYERAAAPEPPAAMSSSQQTEIADMLAQLDETTAADVRAWWKGQRLPKLENLTAAQAAQVIEHLVEHTPAPAPADEDGD